MATLNSGRRFPRRVFLQSWAASGIASTVLGSFSRGFPTGNRPASAQFPGFGKARRVLFLFASGGPSHIDTFDMKPDAPEEIRGAFQSIQTSIAGYRISEHLPRISREIGKCCVFRSMTHDDADHGTACYLTLTGRFHPQKSSNPPPRPDDFPSMSAVYSKLSPHPKLPFSAAHVNGPLLTPIEPGPGQGIGQLPGWTRPAELGNPFESSRNLPLAPTLPTIRVDGRKTLVAELDQILRKTENSPDAWEQHQQRAYQLLSQPEFREALNCDQEKPNIREKYGNHRMGRGCLLGRRLLEAGVPWVTVFLNHSVRGQDDHPTQADWYGWDTHNDIFEAMREILLPRLDQSFSALLQDLADRGLLQDTLVILAGEFGRAPRVAVERNFAGISPGRKHWPAAYTILVAGAGIAAGSLVGMTDRQGGQVLAGRATPVDLMATLLGSLGLQPHTRITDTLGKEFSANEGTPMSGLWRGA